MIQYWLKVTSSNRTMMISNEKRISFKETDLIGPFRDIKDAIKRIDEQQEYELITERRV